MRFIFILSFISFLAHFGVEVPKESTVAAPVIWEQDKKLSWSDFKGTPKTGSPFSAECNWEINYSYSYNPNRSKKLEFEVNCYFNSAKSWVRPKHKTDGLLKHEQAHFDIAELSSRKLRKTLTEAHFNKATFKEEINQIFKNTLQTCDSLQIAYDEETNHGLIKSKQSAWEEFIKSEIQSLDAYQDNKSFENPFREENTITKLFKKLNIF